MSVNFDDLKEKFFLASIDIAIFDGWSNKTLLEASLITGIKLKDAKKMFPRGGIDLARYYHQYEDKIFLKSFREIDLHNLSHFKKIELALFKRFEIIAKNKEAFRKSMALFALPFHQIEGINLVFSTCDMIWVEIGDKSLGYDWYTKRLILVSIYLTSLLFLYGDDSNNNKSTFLFISRKLDELKTLGKIRINYLELFDFFSSKKFKNI